MSRAFVAFALLAALLAGAAQAALAPVELRCEYQEAPLGLDVREPRLSWVVESEKRGAKQSAYRIRAAASRQALEDGQALWDTGKVASDRSTQIAYEGPPLASRTRYYWTVRVWDRQGAPSAWSQPAWFETGLLKPGDWRATWIGAPESGEPERLGAIDKAHWIWSGNPQDRRVTLRRTWVLPEDASIAAARAQLSADNACTLLVNGRQVGETQGWQRLTPLRIEGALRSGENVIEARCRNSDHVGGFLCAMEVTLDNGEKPALVSDNQWLLVSENEEPQAATDYGRFGAAPWGALTPTESPLDPARLYRKPFEASGDIVRARAYVCGLGFYELYVNGERVGDQVLDPALTDYQKRAFYVTYDVTDHLREGENVCGVILGDGWYDQGLVWGGGMRWGEPRVLAQVVVDYANGRTEVIGTDASWLTADSPVRENNIYAGETYDARLELPGWAESGELPQPERWEHAIEVDAPGGALQAQKLPPIRRVEEIRPVAITEPEPGVYVVDMGQNFAGWARLEVEAPEGASVTMRFTEAVLPDGNVDPQSTGIHATHVVQTDTYICKGEGREVWEPRFTYHGFRYVEVTGLPEPPTLDTLTGVVVHTDPETTGTFACSDGLINRIHETALWTERSNLHSVPTDCPHRERCGWTGDAHVSAEMTIYNYDMATFWKKFCRDMETAMLDSGWPTYVAPGKRTCGKASHDWATALVQLPWYVYLYYGDVRALEEHYPSCVRYIEVMEQDLDDDGVFRKEGWHEALGDWCPPGGNNAMDTPKPVTSTAYVYFDYELMVSMSEVLGKPEAAARYRDKAAATRTAFNREFFNAEAGTYGTQTADAMALYLGLPPEGRAQDVADALARRVVEEHGGHHNTGIMGWRFLCQELARYGHEDVALGILQKTTWPSIGHMFTLGATTIWEQWGQGVEPGGKMPGYSLNHPMQGGFDAWFYNGLGGIQPDPARPGFKHTVIRPDFPADLGWARAEYDSIHGRIQSAWHRVNGGLRLDVTIPANTTATVCLEAAPADVRESGSALDETEGVSGVSTENGELRIELGSGDYSFAIGQEEEDGMKIDAATVKEWSEAYRGWQYYPNHVVSAELEPSLGFEAVDCPLVWRHDGEWRMFYTGFDGQGYQTALAVSDDLVHWEPAGRVMGFGKAGAYDHGGVAFCGALFDSYDAGGPRTLKKWNGRYWALYSCYPRQGGYELRPGAEGAAWSEDGETWHRLSDDTPTLSIEGAEPWEEDCIYAPWLLEHEGQFWDFYNAAQASREQMGLAVSNNMADWVRYPGNPVLRNGPAGSYDEQFCSDGKVYRDGDHWTMLYFGVGQGGAHVMAAYSRNLFHWTRDPEPLYQAGGHPGGLDRQYAHKVNLVKDPETGVSYLFYCAVGDQGRGIGLLTSEPL